MADRTNWGNGERGKCAADAGHKLGPTMLTLPQVAAQLQVSTKTVRRLLVKLAVPHVMVGAQIRIPVEHVHLLVSKRWRA